MSTARMCCILFMLSGCAESDGPDATNSPANGTSTGSTTSAGTATGNVTNTGSSTGTSGTGSPWELDVDCTKLLPLPLSYTTHTWTPSHEDFHFSTDGELFGTFGGNLQATPWGGPSSVVVPGVGDARGTRFLADGTMVLANIADQSLYHVDPDIGTVDLMRGGLVNPNGIAIGVDGWVYVTVSEQILRVDPTDGTTEVVVDMPGKSFDGISFSNDYSRLYFNEEFGRIHWVDLDVDGVAGEPFDGPQIPIGLFSILDGMAVDACGNLYVTEMGGKLWRVTPDGEVEVAVDVEAFGVIPAVNFGPDAGGWNPDALYIMDFLGKVHEAEVGVPGKWEPHHP